MRRGLFAGVLVLFALWFVVKAVPFLDRARPATYATPTVQPTDPASLAPIAVKGGQSVCADRMPWGPDARYVQFTLTGSKRPASPLRIVASGPGYRATAQLPAGTAGDVLQTVAITPARTEIPNGTLCVFNEGRHQVKVYGINPGRSSSLSTTKVNGKPIDQELSITLLTHPSQSLSGRLGTIASHIAAFRPVAGWEVFLLGLLAVFGVPVAVAVALSRAAAEDEMGNVADGAEPPPPSDEPEPDPEPQPSARV
ncbi:hypothetical protein [Baekduia sp.]|jgi:hypothetical protein|uniref:hypothetical protein n=1 Tax=Baekduia sp. TaxID=2600305 RepID=UPI002E06142C|nr:hypothetical protein [Baekduia sp.]